MEKNENSIRTVINILSYGILLLFASCKPGFQSIDYGKEACMHCKMTIVDARFASELITSKGRAYKFDDIACMRHYITDHPEIAREAKIFVASYYSDKNEFIEAKNALFLTHEFFASPMNGNIAAFSSVNEAKNLQDSLKVRIVSWKDL